MNKSSHKSATKKNFEKRRTYTTILKQSVAPVGGTACEARFYIHTQQTYLIFRTVDLLTETVITGLIIIIIIHTAGITS